MSWGQSKGKGGPSRKDNVSKSRVREAQDILPR